MSKSNKPASRHRGRDPKKESCWRERLARQSHSSLSVRAFCERETLKESAFYFWRREIERRDRRAMGRQAPTPTFVEVHAAPAQAVALAEHESPLELILSRDRRLLIRVGCDAGLLSRVVAVLEGRSC